MKNKPVFQAVSFSLPSDFFFPFSFLVSHYFFRGTMQKVANKIKTGITSDFPPIIAPHSTIWAYWKDSKATDSVSLGKKRKHLLNLFLKMFAVNVLKKKNLYSETISNAPYV